MTTEARVPELFGADYLRDQLRDHSSCPSCGSLMPARLGDGGCSDCREYPRCACGRWTHDGECPA